MQYVFGELREGDLDEENIRVIIRAARSRVAPLRRVPIADILDLLESLSVRWADPADRFRRRALSELPAQLGYSLPMIAKDIDGFVHAISRSYCEAKIFAELGSSDCLDGWMRRDRPEGGPFIRALSRGVVLHVAAGNVGSVGVMSLVEGLLSKNVGVLKAASAAPLFPILFAESVLDTDDCGIVARSLAVLTWSGKGTRHHKVFQQHADAIVVWGGEDAVKVYREGLGLQATLVEWGPKVSVALVGREAEIFEAARAAAIDVSMWDQNACSSAQVIYVEDRARLGPFVTALGDQLSAFAAEFPPGDLTRQERAEITKTRELARIDVALNCAQLHVPRGETAEARQAWTVIVEDDPAFKTSPLFRTVYVKAVADLNECAELLGPYAAYLQTVGLATSPERLLTIADTLCGAGVLRVTPLGGMGGGHAGEPHDGSIALHRLVKWVSLDAPNLSERFDPVDYLGSEEAAQLQWDRLRATFRRARHSSPFYARRFPPLEPKNLAEWADLPTLSEPEYRPHVPPAGRDLLCGPDAGAYTLRSGGSSGDPKVSLFSQVDFETDMAAAARGAYAAGLRSGDRVANLFYAGNLYGSFISTNRILEILGCRNFPLTSNAPLEDILVVLRTFKIEILIGVPSHLQLVLAAIREARDHFAVRKVFYAGEHFYQKEKNCWNEAIGLERIASIGYGAVDTGPIAYQCPAAEGSVHHLLVGHQYVEILDRDNLRPLPPGEIGEVVVTNLHPRLMPLIRYRIGDVGRLVTGPCTCGRSAPRFELLGRANDVAVVGGYNVAYTKIQRVIEGYQGLLSTPQLELHQPQHHDVLVVKVEQDGTEDVTQLDTEGLRASIVQAVPELGKALRTGMLAAVEIRVLPAGGLERLGRSGKIIHVIDRRWRTGQLV